MRIVETVAGLQGQSRAWHAGGRTIGFVPTMGALHEGHISLVRAARQANSHVVASIFVNPTQFSEQADLDSYPRDFQRDAALLEQAGVDVVFHPAVDEMYPSGLGATKIRPAAVAEGFEGQHRPGHFEGVATVVARLLHAVLPDRAYFGRKDAQQLAVIKATVRDLGLPVEIVGCATVRETDGLAMSSRNARLDPDARRSSLRLVRALAETQVAFAAGDRDVAAITAAMNRIVNAAPEVAVEYSAVVDPRTFSSPAAAAADSLAVVAARVGGVRLIDNAELGARDVVRFAVETPTPIASTPQGVLS